MNTNNPILIIGVGNEYRGDDAAGLMVARELKCKSLHDVDITEASGEGGGLIEMWKGRGTVILIDACIGPEGKSYIRIDADKEFPAAGSLRCSSHAFGVYEAIEMSRALGSLPERLIVYAINGYRFGQGEKLSPDVNVAISKVSDDITAEIIKMQYNS